MKREAKTLERKSENSQSREIYSSLLLLVKQFVKQLKNLEQEQFSMAGGNWGNG